MGILPGAGGTQRLSRLVGVSRAKELIFTGRRIGAKDAHKIGLVDYYVEDGSGYDRAIELACEILPQAPISLKVSKIAIDRGMEMDLDSGLNLEKQCYAQVKF